MGKSYFLGGRWFEVATLCLSGVASLVLGSGILPARAEQTVLGGGVALRQDYDSNINRSYQNEASEWTTAVSPFLSLTSKGADNSLFVRYAPSVVYSHRTDQQRLDHNLAGRMERAWSERLTSSLSDTYVRAEDPYQEEEVGGINLSDNRGRNRYWVNRFDIGLGYLYASESALRLSYQNQILDNSGSGQEDFRKNTPGFSITHFFNRLWQGRCDYAFTKGDFDQSDDLKRHTLATYLYFTPTPESKFFGHYGYANTDYDGLQDDYFWQSTSLGWARQLSAVLDFEVEGGGVFLDRDNGANTSDLYYSLALRQKNEHGAISLSAKGGVDEQQFNGASDEGVSRYWSLAAGISRELRKDLRAAVKCSYREDKYLDQAATEKKEVFKGEALLSYSFARWYEVSARYIYTNQNADLVGDRYDDHRLLLELSAHKDFCKW